MENKNKFYIFMAVIVGIIILLLGISAVENLIKIINYVEDVVSIGFYITVMVLEILVIGLFGFIEYLLLKILIGSKK